MKILAVIVALALSGCAAAHIEQAQSECQRLMDDTALDVLRPKIVIGTNDEVMTPSLAKQADKDVPGDAERVALAVYEQALRQCFAKVDNAPRATDPRYKHVEILRTGTVSYGDYNRAMAQTTRDISMARASAADRQARAIGNAADHLERYQTRQAIDDLRTQQTIDSFRRIAR